MVRKNANTDNVKECTYLDDVEMQKKQEECRGKVYKAQAQKSLTHREGIAKVRGFGVKP